jgi:hypothetical protein
MSRRTGIVVAVAVLVLVAAGVVAATWRPGDGSTTGTGLTYEGRFYWASGQRVREDALGDPVATAVLFQDTTADLRRIDGLDPHVTLAALLPSLDGSPGGLRWTLVSTDQGRGTNPGGYDDTRAVLVATG